MIVQRAPSFSRRELHSQLPQPRAVGGDDVESFGRELEHTARRFPRDRPSPARLDDPRRRHTTVEGKSRSEGSCACAVLAVLPLFLASRRPLACADLPSKSLDVCGNGVVEIAMGEQCDLIADAKLGDGTECGKPDDAVRACRYVMHARLDRTEVSDQLDL